jgi:nucleoid-associated protein YgaU
LIPRAILVLVAALTIAGCDKVDRERQALEAADRNVKARAYRDAIKNYESALDGTAKTAEVHYKMAVLYDGKLKDSLSAIHHYDRYLDFAPNGDHAKEAKSARTNCERLLQAKMSKEGFMTTSEAARLRNQNESLLRDLMDMRTRKGPAPARTPDPSAADRVPPGSRQHTVEPGDTLASIAVKYYNSRGMAGHIKDANFNQLGGKDVIKPGQVLIIPEAPRRRD